MKLILSVDALSPLLSGIGRYTWELVSRMEREPGIERVRYFRVDRWIDDPAVLLTRVRRRHFTLSRWAPRWYWQHAFRGQVFHSPNYFLPPFAENGVVTVHDLSVFKYPETHPVERVNQFEKLFRKTLDSAVHLITDSEATRVEVIDFFGWPSDQITTVHLGVSSAFAPRSAEILAQTLACFNLNPGGYTLCVSTLDPRKRISALLDAYGQLPVDLRNRYPLVLVGDKGWRSERLHERINAAQHDGWLRYLGFLPEADLPVLYAGARVFAYPSIYEGFGLPIAEAMASGVPVVTSNRSCMPEVAGGAARMVNPDDVDALALGLEEGLVDTVWREKAIAREMQVAARYSWGACVQQTAAVYAEAVRN